VNVADTLRAAEEQLRGRSESARLDAEVLLGHVLGWNRALLISAGRDEVDSTREKKFSDLIQRCAAGEPVAYLTGMKEFWSLPLKVTPDVLIPRPETETLVEWALDVVVDVASPRVADLGTGSGAIALAIASERPDAKIVATDQSAKALRVAQANAKQLGIGNVRFAQGSWLEPLKGELFDLIISNPPYVAAGDPHLEALRHEPESALVAGDDGLEAIRAIATEAPKHLRSLGWLLLEHGAGQAEAVRQELADAGFASATTIGDLGALPRVTGGRVGGRE
jgi:release factor glutamine methyltransferase